MSSSARKRHHSNSDRERCKRTKVASNASHQSELSSTRGRETREELSYSLIIYQTHNASIYARVKTFCKRLHFFTIIGSDSIEATPLESLPGHTETSTRQSKYVASDKEKPKDECNSFQWERQGLCVDSINTWHSFSLTMSSKVTRESFIPNRLGGDGDQDVLNMETTNAVANSLFKENNIKSSCSIEKRTAATSTEELTSCLCAQVQTTHSDTPESESDGNDEPIENLSVSIHAVTYARLHQLFN